MRPLSPDLLEILACPRCVGPLQAEWCGTLDQTSSLVCTLCGSRYTVEEGAPRLLDPPGLDPTQAYFEDKATDDSLGAMDYRTRASFRLRQRWLERVLSGAPPGWLIDTGCGNGRMTAPWTTRRPVVGIDSSFRMVAWARERGIAGVEGNVERLPLRSGCAAVVVGMEVMQYLVSPRRMLEEVARIAAPGTHLCLSWLPPSIPRRVRRRSLGLMAGSPQLHAIDPIVRLLSAHGWSRIEIEAGLWPWPSSRRLSTHHAAWLGATVVLLHGIMAEWAA